VLGKNGPDGHLRGLSQKKERIPGSKLLSLEMDNQDGHTRHHGKRAAINSWKDSDTDNIIFAFLLLIQSSSCHDYFLAQDTIAKF
jgi:hypothetical protein